MSILNLFNLGSFAGSDTGESFPLPADSVLLWDRESESIAVPDGFSLYTSADERLIQGTTTIGDIGVTGGTSGTFSAPGAGSGTNSPHSGPPVFSTFSRSTPGSTIQFPFSNPQGAGSHFHPTSSNPVTVPSNIRPMGRFMTLITNSSQVDNVPLNCVVFSSFRPAFFTRKTFDTHSVGLYTGTTTFSRVKAADTFPFFINWNSAGGHTHESPTGFPNYGPSVVPGSFTTLISYNPSPSSAPHTHPSSTNVLTVYQQFKHLLPFMASTNRPVRSGMIVMFKGSSIPSGWKICDGTNGTPNMNGFFLGYDNNENGHDIVKSNKRVNTVPAGYPLPTTNPPSPTNYEILASFSTPTIPWNHHHEGAQPGLPSGFSMGADHRPTNFPHSHTYTSISFPINFTANFIKLVFIQKE